MKRKNLQQAIVLGVVLASFGSCVWAEEINNHRDGGVFVGYDYKHSYSVDNYYPDYINNNLKGDIEINNFGIFVNVTNADKCADKNKVDIKTDGILSINLNEKHDYNTVGAVTVENININQDSSIILDAKGINIFRDKSNSGTKDFSGICLNSNSNSSVTTYGKADFTANVQQGDFEIDGFEYGIIAGNNSNVIVKDADNITINTNYAGIKIVPLKSDNAANIDLNGNNINFYNDSSNNYGILVKQNSGKIDLNAKNDISFVNRNGIGYTAIEASNNHLEGQTGSGITLSADNNVVIDNFETGILNDESEMISVTGGNIFIQNVKTGIDSIGGQYSSSVILSTENNNDENEQEIIKIFADNTAVSAKNNNSEVDISGESNNLIGGTDAVVSKSKAVVNITGTDNFIGNTANGTGTLAEQEKHALYASNAGIINVTANGGMNTIISDGYRTIHAEGDGIFTTTDINITGGVYIANKNALPSVKSVLADENISKIAIVASSNGILANGVVNIDLNGTNTIRSGISDDNYKGEYAGGNVIYGSVIAGKDGKVNINTNLPSTMTLADTSDNRGSISVYGNVMAGNQGELNLDLGNGGYLEGRVDDYQDAAIQNVNESHGNGFYNPEFSKEITDRGEVNLTMGNKAYWNVTGQSWVSSLTTTGDSAVIDMVGEDNITHAVTIENMQGNANFKMCLNGNEKVNSDMLYMKYVQGSYNIYLDRMVTDSEIGENGLRFATVGDGSSAEFKVFASDKGFFDKEYTVGSEDYVKGDSANSDYNGDSLDDRKPGKEAVDNYFDGTYTKAIATLADNTGDLLQNDTNFKLIGSSSEISDGGETILNMSRANYSNAVYMDRLNKRLGEARYIDGDEGIWMRLRHDRIGKQDDFRSMNTMYEIGYDRKADVDNGQRRIGIAGDYMQGSTEYTGVSGSGDIKRIGLWAYDTWLGDKGHYADYVVKWGHLSNDFNLFRNDKISGDYSNDVFSVSAEYGKKNDIGGDWYFEPQAQLQYAYVTDAHYSSSQGTEVDVDSIHSLIARGGFRIGKDFGSEKKSTVYFKADIMHEFLGDQDIAVRDSSTDGRWTAVGYGNEGTWFDVGFGFAAQTGDNSYVYLDLEQSFGNDNEDTYQINAGMQWSF